MKKLFACFFIIASVVGIAMADDAVTISRAIIQSKPKSEQPIVTPESQAGGQSRVAITRTVVPKSPVPLDTQEPVIIEIPNDEDVAVSDATVVRSASRAIGNTVATDGTRGAGAVSRTGISRSVNVGVAGQREALESTVRTVGRNARTSAAGINNSPAARRAGVSLRPSTAEVGGRAKIAGTDIQTGSNIGLEARAVQTRAAAGTQATKETITVAKERLESTADLNKSCQAQYNDCMDQFCSVIDQNQKRCSCSSNLSRYTKAESAVKNANSQLNEVAQRIRYVGLSADEIRAIMSATEAETALTGKKDTTESRNMLEAIEKMIKNPTAGASSSGGNVSSLDLDLDFSADSSNELFSLEMFGGGASSFSNLRGADLYSAAKKRCNTILTQCKTAGATQNQITGNYDLAIDKDCIAYEQGLNKMNETLKNNVRSADQMLKKARLAVLENKNQYDAKGCVAALDNCMTDDMVCGENYEKCLDPTKQFIDENGKVVLGRDVTNIIAFMKTYESSAINKSYLKDKAMTMANMTTGNCAQDASTSGGGNDGRCLVKYLLGKIGTGKTFKDGGLCRAVLDKCQYSSYSSAGAYDPYNDVVVNYIQRAMTNIQADQRRIISDYASTCMIDIASCYNQQVSQVNTWSTSASINSVYNVMRGACRSVALTCAYAVFQDADTSAGGICGAQACDLTTQSSKENAYITAASEMFYQSLLCPENSAYQNSVGTPGTNGYVNERCKCENGYSVWGKTCTRNCNAGTIRNQSTGQCDLCPSGTYSRDGDTQCFAAAACPVGSYCPSSSSVAMACPAGTTSPLGSTAVGGCTPCTPAGNYCIGGAPATQCPAGSYCPAGASAPTACPAGTTSPAGAISAAACV